VRVQIAKAASAPEATRSGRLSDPNGSSANAIQSAIERRRTIATTPWVFEKKPPALKLR
jgi:SH3-like domain-containing protein